MIRINLLPVKATQKKEKLRSQLVVLALALAVVAAGCSIAHFSIGSRIAAERQEVANKQQEINNLKKSLGEVAQFKKRQEELRGKLKVLERLKEDRKGPVRLLDDLSAIIPGKLWVTAFKESAGNITIGGVGMNEETVAEFMRSLETSPYYQKVELRVIEQQRQSEQKVHKFELSCQVENPPAG